MVRCTLAAILIGIYLTTIPIYNGLGKGVARPQYVILIVVDTLAAQNLGYMGYERDTSPFIDELASKSVVFDRCYTPKSTTMPSFTSMLSGLHPIQHGVITNGIKLPDEIHFLTEYLQAAGFETWGIPASRVIGMQYGFNKGFTYYGNASATPRSAGEIKERLERILKNSPRFGEPSLANIHKPLFLMVHFYDTHTPFTPDEKVLSEFSHGEYTGPVDGTWREFEKYNNGEIEYDDDDIQRTIDLYDAEIKTFDRKLRDIFDLFDEVGLLDNSIVILTADHGENLGEHGFITHGHPYERALHIPLFIKFPNDENAGMRIRTPVENIDIMPTILDVYGIHPAGEIEGRSLLPLFSEDTEDVYEVRDYFYAIGNPTDGGRTFSAFDGQYRLIVDTGTGGDALLYDELKDPLESRNLMKSSQENAAGLAYFLDGCISATDGTAIAESEMDDETIEMLASLGYLH